MDARSAVRKQVKLRELRLDAAHASRDKRARQILSDPSAYLRTRDGIFWDYDLTSPDPDGLLPTVYGKK